MNSDPAPYRLVRHAVEPSDEPGSGWLTRVAAAPGTPVDLQNRSRCAWIGYILPIRRNGMRVRAAELLAAKPRHGGLLCEDNYKWWNLTLHNTTDFLRHLDALVDVRLVRCEVATRQYSGWQSTGINHHFHGQTWLCSKTEAGLRTVLDRMVTLEETTDPNAKYPRGLFRQI